MSASIPQQQQQKPIQQNGSVNGTAITTGASSPLPPPPNVPVQVVDKQTNGSAEKPEKKKKLRRKQLQPKPVLKYAWLAGHGATVVFGTIYFAYYFTHQAHKSYVASGAYLLSLIGVWVAYTVAILSLFNRKSLPSYYGLMVTENFQYLVLSFVWFFGWSSAFKIFPYWSISLLQLSRYFNVKPVLKLEKVLEKAILYDEALLFVILLSDTLRMKGPSGYGLVIYVMFYWLRLLHSQDNRFFVFSLVSKLDSVVSKQKNPKIVEAWASAKEFLTVKQSKFEHQFLDA